MSACTSTKESDSREFRHRTLTLTNHWHDRSCSGESAHTSTRVTEYLFCHLCLGECEVTGYYPKQFVRRWPATNVVCYRVQDRRPIAMGWGKAIVEPT